MKKMIPPKNSIVDINNFFDFFEFLSTSYGLGDVCSFETDDGIVHKISFERFKRDVINLGLFLDELGYVGEKIALISNNRYEYIVAFLSIILSRNVAVPINKDIYCDELAIILDDFNPRMILYSDNMTSSVEELKNIAADAYLLNMDDFDSIQERYNKNGITDIPKHWSQDIEIYEKPCCIIYTSGTSGTPKGVMLSQDNVLSDVTALFRAFPIDGSVMLYLPLHHMYAWTASVFLPMLSGAEIIVCCDSRKFSKDLCLFSPHNLVVVPAIMEFYYKRIQFLIKRSKESKMYQELLNDDGLMKKSIDERREIFADVTKDLGLKLKSVICGAAMVDREMILFFQKLGIIIFVVYGMTECSPVVSICQKNNNRIGSVGKLLDCNEVRIGNPDEDGVGEIYIKGKNVMLGYYHRAEATAEVYEDNWLRSGDRGYIDEDGFLYISGRYKNVIIRSSGENISPEELELKIANLQNVEEVLVCENSGLIIAKIYAGLCEETTKEQIKTGIVAINSVLPAYKRIDKVEFVDQPFERTSTNKIKRI